MIKSGGVLKDLERGEGEYLIVSGSELLNYWKREGEYDEKNVDFSVDI